MASSVEVKSIIQLFDDGLEVSPGIDEEIIADAITTSMNDINILASATDQVIPLSNKGTVKELRIFTDYASTDSLTCKINGQSTAWTINPFQIFTEDVNSLTVSNSATTAKVINIEVISTT